MSSSWGVPLPRSVQRPLLATGSVRSKAAGGGGLTQAQAGGTEDQGPEALAEWALGLTDDDPGGTGHGPEPFRAAGDRALG